MSEEKENTNTYVWDDNTIQFPRLLAEINAVVDLEPWQKNALMKTMDLNWEEIQELFDRAEKEWQRIKDELTDGEG